MSLDINLFIYLSVSIYLSIYLSIYPKNIYAYTNEYVSQANTNSLSIYVSIRQVIPRFSSLARYIAHFFYQSFRKQKILYSNHV